jgi:hypothetical protein
MLKRKLVQKISRCLGAIFGDEEIAQNKYLNISTYIHKAWARYVTHFEAIWSRFTEPYDPNEVEVLINRVARW